MNILVLEDSSQANYGGGQKISKIVVEALSTEHNLFLCDYVSDTLFVKDVAPYVNQICVLKKSNSGNKNLRRICQVVFFLENFFTLKSFIKRNEISLILATTKLTLIAAFFTGKPFVYHAHMAMQKGYLNHFLVLIMKRAKLVITVSKFVQNSILKFNNSVNTIVLYNPIEFVISQPRKRKVDQKLHVSFFGTLKEEKGLRLIIQLAILFKQDPAIQFNIFGDGHLHSEIRNLNLPNVRLYGHIHDVEYYLNTLTDILVLPSVIPEACPTIILQAMSQGVPIVTTNFGGQNELVKNGINGYTFSPTNITEFANRIIYLKNNYDDYEQISLNNLTDITQYPSLKEYKLQILNSIYIR